MWIRSQNKKSMFKINSIEIVERRSIKEYFIKGFNENSSISIELGIYSTEEKALKVLDMIDYALQGLVLLSNGKVTHTPETKVFQMPQDNEVLND